MQARPNLKKLSAQVESLEASNVLATQHLGLVRAIVFSRFSRFNFATDDLISVGYIALLRASRTWEDRGVQKFSSFAYTCIVSAIYKWIRYESVLGRSLSKRKADFELIANEKITYIDFFSAKSQVELRDLDTALTRKALNHLLARSGLTNRERSVIQLRFRNVSDEDAAVELGVKKDTVRTIFHCAMKKVRRTAIAVNFASITCV